MAAVVGFGLGESEVPAEDGVDRGGAGVLTEDDPAGPASADTSAGGVGVA